MAALEAAFCDSIPFPNDPVIVNDARNDPRTVANPWVIGPPYIRFYAVQTIFDNKKVVGAIYLIDYVARQYQEEDTFLLNDLAGLVEQELMFDSLQAANDDMTRQNRSLRRESMIDPVFGTWNRSAILRSLEIEVDRCKKAGKPLSLAMISVDNYNDLKNDFGLHSSESILIVEEFLVVLPGASHVVIQAITERIRSTVMAHPETLNDKSVAVTVSAGTVSTDVVFTDPDGLLNRVHQALHAAQKMGKNCVVHSAPDTP